MTLAGAPQTPPYLDRVPDHSLDLLVHEASSAGIVAPEALLLRRKLAAKGNDGAVERISSRSVWAERRFNSLDDVSRRRR